jgi:hypothetical protein
MKWPVANVLACWVFAELGVEASLELAGGTNVITPVSPSSLTCAAPFQATTLIASATTASSNPTSGSLVAAGGAGVGGNLNVGGDVSAQAFREAGTGAPVTTYRHQVSRNDDVAVLLVPNTQVEVSNTTFTAGVVKTYRITIGWLLYEALGGVTTDYALVKCFQTLDGGQYGRSTYTSFGGSAYREYVSLELSGYLDNHPPGPVTVGLTCLQYGSGTGSIKAGQKGTTRSSATRIGVEVARTPARLEHTTRTHPLHHTIPCTHNYICAGVCLRRHPVERRYPFVL